MTSSGTLDKILDLTFARLWVFGRFFTEKITVHNRKKGKKNPDIIRPTFIHEGIKATEGVFVCTSRSRHNSSDTKNSKT